MKTLYLIGGPMGVGKTTTGRMLADALPRCAFLDGDWCWDIHPFTVTDETKALVMGNIIHMLQGYLRCSEVENVVFCWVMHQQAIVEEILAALDLSDVRVVAVSLVCSPDALTARLQRDIDAGIRQADVIPHALDRLACFPAMRTHQLDTTDLTPAEAARLLQNL